MADRTCTIDGCTNPVFARGWCDTHYGRWRRNGDPFVRVRLMLTGTPEERFWARVKRNGPVPPARPDLGPCWPWQGFIADDGYGHFARKGALSAHRFAYELLVGQISEGLQLDHLCRVRHCVNPSHLEPVTNKVNVLRGVSPTAINARKTHCKRGHEFTPENTRVRPTGGRSCRACERCYPSRTRLT